MRYDVEMTDTRVDRAVRNENNGPAWERAAVIAGRAARAWHLAGHGYWLWFSPGSVAHAQPYKGPCITCGDAHPRRPGLTVC